MHCEDFPCCGHEPGCCPDRDPETGRVIGMRCCCGASVPLTSRWSMCRGCVARMMRDDDGATMACDCCGLARKTRSVPSGRDPGGDMFTSEVCFLCEVESGRGRYFDRKTGRYARPEPPSLASSGDDEIPW